MHLIISLFIHDMLIIFIVQQEVLYYLIKQMALLSYLGTQATIHCLCQCIDGTVLVKQKYILYSRLADNCRASVWLPVECKVECLRKM